MDTDRKILRLGAVMILFALLLRLAGNTGFSLGKEELISAILFLRTGRLVRPEDVHTMATLPPATEPAQETVVREPAPLPVIFTPESAQTVQISNQADYAVEVDAMLRREYRWNLRGAEPTVLILHTHGTESYRNTENYPQSGEYRTEDDRYNMISVGDRLVQRLEAAGIRVIHDRTAYDLPSYSGSYSQAREAVARLLRENPSVCLVLDLHRDAMTDENGDQIGYTLSTDRGTAARLMLVSGSDAGGLSYPNWQENLTLAVQLQAVLEETCPGICRPLSFRTGRYNQDLFPNMLLVEVGAAGNTRQEALLAMEALSQAIIAMADGTRYEE